MGIRNWAAALALALWGALAWAGGADLRGASRQEGPIPLWSLRDGRTLAEIPESLEARSLTACALAVDGDWDGWSDVNQAAQCQPARFRVEGPRAKVSLGERGALSLPVEGRTPEGGALIDAKALAEGDWTGILEAGEALGADEARLAGARASEPETRIAYWRPFRIEGGGGSLLIRLSFLHPSRAAMTPRAGAPEIGHLLGSERSRGSMGAPYPYPIMRWNLAPSGGRAARPIRAILSASIPEDRREAVRQGVLSWSGAFEKAGIAGAIEVSEGGGGAEEILGEGAVIVRWNSRPDPEFAVARVAAEDGTGEAHAACVTLAETFASEGRRAAKIEDPQASEERLEAGANAALRETAAHEFGHALGLEHNFRGSAAASVEEALRPESPFLSASVMDYLPNAVPLRDGRWASVAMAGPGPYDEWAIEYAYRDFPEGGEAAGLARIAARGRGEARLAFGAQGAASGAAAFDPLNAPGDFSDDPVEAFRLYLGAAKGARKHKTGLGGLDMALVGLVTSADSLERILAGGGGSPSAARRAALDALAEALREGGLEAVGPWMEIRGAGAWALRPLAAIAASPKVAAVAPYLDASGLSYAEILGSLREAIWGETLRGKAPSRVRAMMLREHAKALAGLASDPSIPRSAKAAAEAEAQALAAALGRLPAAGAETALEAAKPLLDKARALAAKAR